MTRLPQCLYLYRIAPGQGDDPYHWHIAWDKADMDGQRDLYAQDGYALDIVRFVPAPGIYGEGLHADPSPHDRGESQGAPDLDGGRAPL